MDTVSTEPVDTARREEEGRPREGLLRTRNFRLFFFGQLVSNSGTWLQNVAQGVLVLRLTDSSFMVGVSNAALFVPVTLLALVGGGLADRFDRRRLLIGTQVLAMAATAALAVLAATGNATTAAVIVVATLIGIQYAVSIPAMGAFLPGIVERDRLGQAIGLNSVTYNLARALGPALATAAIATVGFAWAFGLNSLSFAALIVALLAMRLEKPTRPAGGSGSAREVLAYAWRTPRILVMLLGIASIAIAIDPVITLSPTFARDVFGRSEADAGIIVSAFGTGAILAAVVLVRAFRGPTSRRIRWLPWSMLLMAAGLTLFAFSSTLWVGALGVAVAGFGSLASSTTWTTSLQEEVDDRMRGRIMGLWTLCFLGMRPVAALVDGGVADLVSPRAGVLVVLVPLVLVTAFGVRRVRAD